MNYPIHIQEINSSVEFHNEVLKLKNEAETYIKQYPWCAKIYGGWLITNIGFAVNIYLFKIENTQSTDDDLIWVIVGDFPPMYLDTYNVSSTTEVCETYIELASEWIAKVENSESIEECYPLDANQDKNSIELLKRKVKLLREKILPNIKDIEFNAVLNNGN